MANKYEEIQFEINGIYRNRIGYYRVLKIQGDNLLIEYESNKEVKTLHIPDQKRIMANMYREEKTVGPIASDRNAFFSYVEECNKSYRSGHDLGLYRKIIDMHRSGQDLGALIDNDRFIELIAETLSAWNMDQRGAALISLDNMKSSIRAYRSQLIELYKYKLSALTSSDLKYVSGLLKQAFIGLEIMKSNRRIVGVSKALHFILPDLVVPIDGTYTLIYFYGYNKYGYTAEAEWETFNYIFSETFKIAQKLKLAESDVTGVSWGTSVPKLIDDAIIGLFCVIRDKLAAQHQLN